jgi:site-specific recombinase XerD
MPGSMTPGIPPRRCFEQGVHIHVVQEVLGHTRVTTTERYTHVATLQMKDASERMSDALWGQE